MYNYNEQISQLFENDRITQEAVEKGFSIIEQKLKELAHEITKDRCFLINIIQNQELYDEFSTKFDEANKE